MAVFSGIAAAFTAVSTWIGGLSAIGSFALKTAVGIGLSLAAQKLAGKSRSQDQTFSLSTAIQGGGDLSRSFIMGRAATGGSLVWANTWGRDGRSPNAWLTQVIALSDLPVRGLAEFWVDGVRVGYDASRNNDTIYGQEVGEFNKDGANMYIKFYDGTQTTYDPALVTIDSTDNRTWNIDRIGDGVAYVIIRCRATKNMFSGIPRFLFVVDGIRCYDPSRDSTRGGDGPQRIANPSTWGGDGDDLPVVQIYNIMMGITYKGNWVYGFQNMSPNRLDYTWITQINKCRRQVLGASGMEPQYRSGGEIVVSAPISEALDTLLTACQGEIAEAGGIYSVLVGEPEAPLFSITDDDILSTEEQRFTPFYGLADSINGITGTYPEPLENWGAKAAPPIYRPDLEALDGNRRLLANVEFTFVPYAEQVQRLMKSALLAAMRNRRHTLTLPPRFWEFCVPGDSFLWTSERNGYVNKRFIIKGAIDKSNLDCTIDVLEWDPSDYSWSSSEEFRPPVIGELGPIIPAPQPILDWNVFPYILRDQENGARRPAIRMIWDNNSDTLIGVRGVEWQVRVQGQTELVSAGNTTQPERGSAIISAGILPNTRYEARGRFIPLDDSRETIWSEFIPVITDNVLLGEGDIEVELGVIGDDAKSVWKVLGQQLDDVWKRIEHLGQSQTLEGAVGEVARTEIRTQVGRASAAIIEEREVRATETEALARAAITLEAKVDTNDTVVNARISDESVVRASEDAALSQRINAANVQIGNNTASIADEQLARVTADEALAQRVTFTEAAVGDNTAAIASEQTARVNGDTALGQRIDTVNVTVGQNSAAIQNESTARVDGDTALATQIQAVRAEIESGFADGMVRFEAVAAPSGVNVRYAVLIRASMNDNFLASGFYLEIYTEGGQLRSRMVVSAQQFLVASDTVSAPVFAVINEQVYIINARIQQAQIDNLLVGTSNIVPGAISAAFSIDQSGSNTVDLNVSHGEGSPRIFIFFSSELITQNNQQGANIIYSVTNLNDNVQIGRAGLTNPGTNNDGVETSSFVKTVVPPSGRTSTTFRISRQAPTNLSTTSSMIALVVKR